MKLGHYHTDRLVREKALDSLYEGFDTRSKRQVAIRLLSINADPSVLERLRSLSQALARLPDATAANVVGIEECGRSADGALYLVSPLVRGRSLDRILAKPPGLLLPLALSLGEKLARTLASAGSAGIYHFALRPSQIVTVEPLGEKINIGVRVLGLGLAATLGLLDVGPQSPVLPPFAAPEQYPAQAGHLPTLGGSADVFALGVLLWQVVTGSSPFPQEGPLKGSSPTLTAGNSPLPDGLAILLVRMVSVNASERPSMDEVAEIFARLNGHSKIGIDEEPATVFLPSENARPAPRLSPDVQPAQKIAAPAIKPANLAEPSRFDSSAGPTPNSDREAPDARIGMLFGNFRLTQKLGEGGMGVVYKAKHRMIGRLAAVKIMHPEFAQNPGYASRFLNEARAVNIIQHPGLVEIFEYGQLPDGTLYIVMEFLRGGSLQQRIESRKRAFGEDAVLGIGLQVARALDAAHGKGIIHRDLKPENIMLVPEPIAQEKDWVKILDFGIAKVHPRKSRSTGDNDTESSTGVGAVMGTPMYMAPEQFGKAEEVNGQADVFSLGVVLYELLTSQPPYGGTSLSLLNRPVRPLAELSPGVTPKLAALIHRMLSVSAADRPSMAEVAEQLAKLRPSGFFRGAATGYNQTKKRRLVAALATTVLVALAIILTLTLQAPQKLSIAEAKEHALVVINADLKSNDALIRIKAITELGKSGDMNFRSMLEPLLQNPSQEVVAQAARALGRLGAVDSQKLLVATLEKQPTASVQMAIAESLARLKHPAGVPLLTQMLEDESTEPEHRYRAAIVLLELNNLTGVPTIWEQLSHGNISLTASLSMLGQLALAGEVQAHQRLTEALQQSSDHKAQIFAAWSLARLGDDKARASLLNEAGKSGMDQLLAAQLAAELGEPLGYALFAQLAPSSREPDAIREQAIAGLASCGEEDGLTVLDIVINQKHTGEALRLAAAGAMLRIVSGERIQLAQQSLNWAQAALDSDSAVTRELAAAALGEINSDATIPPLSRALRDQQRDVRRTAARALGRKSVRAALEALSGSLDDQDIEVRATGMRAIRRVVDALRSKGDRQADQLVLKRLDLLSKEGSEQDRTVASGILLQLGDANQQSRLTVAFASRNSLVRKLAVEFTEGESGLLERALKDDDGGVRFAAARRLAERGSHLGAQVLRETAQRGDLDGLVAYGKLKSLGESATPPAGLSQLLRSGDLQTRFDALDAVAELPPERALALLYTASRDSAGVLRRRAAEIAGESYKRTASGAYLNLIKGLRRDPDALVRSAAAELTLTLTPKPSRSVQATSKDITKSEGNLSAKVGLGVEPNVKPAVASATGGVLIFLAEELVRIQIDGGPSQAVPSEAISVVSGQHRISYAGGEQTVTVTSGQTVTISIPTTYAEQLLHDGIVAYQEKRFDRAQQCLERVRLLQDRGLVKRNLLPDLALSLARLYESQNELKKALQEYNRLQGMADLQNRPELRRTVERALARLSPSVGHVVLFRRDPSGKCVRSDQYMPPGDQVVYSGWNIGLVEDAAAKVDVVQVKAGATITVNRCR